MNPLSKHQEIRNILDYYLNRFVAKDLDAIRSVMDGDVHLFDPFVGNVYGIDAVMDVYRGIFSGCSNLDVRNVRIILDADEPVAAVQLEVICDTKTISVVDVITFSQSWRILSLVAYLNVLEK